MELFIDGQLEFIIKLYNEQYINFNNIWTVGSYYVIIGTIEWTNI